MQITANTPTVSRKRAQRCCGIYVTLISLKKALRGISWQGSICSKDLCLAFRTRNITRRRGEQYSELETVITSILDIPCSVFDIRFPLPNVVSWVSEIASCQDGSNKYLDDPQAAINNDQEPQENHNYLLADLPITVLPSHYRRQQPKLQESDTKQLCLPLFTPTDSRFISTVKNSEFGGGVCHIFA